MGEEIGAERPEPMRSLHDGIRRDLERRIFSGDWSPGHKVPSEAELSQDYGCSRMTVNKVMTELSSAGLILRRRRACSIVLPQTSQNAVLEIHDIKDEVLSRGGWYRHRIERLDATRATGPVCSGHFGGVATLSVDCLHYSDDAPFCFEERLISLAAVPEAKEADFALTAPGAWLLKHVPWTEAENEVGSRTADRRLAGRLGIAEGAACLTMTRRTWKNGEPVTAVDFTYPGVAHKFTAKFTPAKG